MCYSYYIVSPLLQHFRSLYALNHHIIFMFVWWKQNPFVWMTTITDTTVITITRNSIHTHTIWNFLQRSGVLLHEFEDWEWYCTSWHFGSLFNPLMPTGAFNICCPRDCVSRHNGGTSGAPLKPLRVDSALRALSTLRGLRGAPAVPPLCRETSVSRTVNVERNGGQKWVNVPLAQRPIGCPCWCCGRPSWGWSSRSSSWPRQTLSWSGPTRLRLTGSVAAQGKYW